MKKVAILAASAALSLFSAHAFGLDADATCVNSANALKAQRDKAVEAKVEEYKYYQCVNPHTGLYFNGKAPNLISGPPKSLDQCLKDIRAGVEASAAIKKMDAAFVAKGNECQALAKTEAAKFSKKVPDCKVRADSPTTLHCATPAAYQACLKEKPYSPNCGIWNGEHFASCCQLGG
jgi:hypothetical protein